MFSKRILVLAACISSFVLSSLAQQPNQSLPGRPASEPVATKNVRGNLYQVSGGIGNAFFYVGPGEVLVIDAKIKQKKAKVKTLVQEGKSLAEVQKAFAGADQPAEPGGRRWPSLVEIIYQELTEKK
jgi:hypothetical protein